MGFIRRHEHGTHDDTLRDKTIKPLPETYTVVNPAAYYNEKPPPSRAVGFLVPDDTLLSSDTAQTTWLDKLNELLKEDETGGTDNISWPAHFASLQNATHPPAITVLLPLFHDNAHSLAMVKHGMNVIQQATEHVNPAQVPVITMDQPLYAIGEKIQCRGPAIWRRKVFGDDGWTSH